MDKYKFGNFIYNKRKELNITQEDLGKKLGVTNKAVSKWETGETLPDINLLEPLANILNVSINELVTLRKDEIHYEKDPNTKKYVMCIVILAIIVFVFLILQITGTRTEYEDISLNSYNINEYFDVNESINFTNNGLEISIKNEIIKNTTYNVSDFSLSVDYKINYKYLNTSGEISTITYIKEDIAVEVIDDCFIITEKPKNEISDFVNFYSYSIDLQLNPKGVVKDVVKE